MNGIGKAEGEETEVKHTRQREELESNFKGIKYCSSNSYKFKGLPLLTPLLSPKILLYSSSRPSFLSTSVMLPSPNHVHSCAHSSANLFMEPCRISIYTNYFTTSTEHLFLKMPQFFQSLL